MKGKYLLLGTNLGNRLNNLNKAILAVENLLGPIKQRSSIFETEPWGFQDQPTYYNQVLEIDTMLTPDEILKNIFLIEKAMGRTRHEKWKERLIDIDILYYEDEVINSNKLTIPHPQIQNRKFTLVPLCEISAHEIHPVLKKSNQELLRITTDSLQVKKI